MLHYFPSFWYQTQIFEKKIHFFQLSFEGAFGSSSLTTISDFSGQIYAEYLSFTMAISVSPRYPSHYLYPIHTCACDLCP